MYVRRWLDTKQVKWYRLARQQLGQYMLAGRRPDFAIVQPYEKDEAGSSDYVMHGVLRRAKGGTVSIEGRAVSARFFGPGRKYEYCAWASMGRVVRAEILFASHEHYWLAPWAVTLKVSLRPRSTNEDVRGE